MEGIIKTTIIGNFRNYTRLQAEQGYCFYDDDESEENRNYIESIDTPILDETELERKFVAVKGSVEELNEQVRLEMEEKTKGVENE